MPKTDEVPVDNPESNNAITFNLLEPAKGLMQPYPIN